MEDIVIKEVYTNEDMPVLVRDYFLSAKNAFDIISLMKEKAYSRETEKYAKECEEELKDISFRVTKEINEMLSKRETRSISKKGVSLTCQKCSFIHALCFNSQKIKAFLIVFKNPSTPCALAQGS